MPGRLVYVMGPSGAGKDTLLAYARRRLAGSEILFAHRYITRAPRGGDENFIALSGDEFERRRERGFFLFCWEAHGTRYGIGQEVRLWLGSCKVVVVSGSRAHFADARPSGALPVLITAPYALLAARLAARGREEGDAVAARLARTPPAPAGSITIENAGKLEVAGELLVDLLTSLATESVPAR